MSGGVDSSVAVMIMVQQNFQVIGMMLRLWSEPGKSDSNRCCTPDAMANAQRVAAILGIPFYAIDAQDIFYKTVVSGFVDGYAQGFTPNPCLICNRIIRWDFLLKHAQALGADYLATGHYARTNQSEDGLFQLWRCDDKQKDQSYVLHVLGQKELSQTIFPLGDITKSKTRQLAAENRLPIADRRESQDLCFLAGEDYRNFLLRNSSQVFMSGPIINKDGNVLGEHSGLALYTIGQRKGLGIFSSQPLYVLEKRQKTNTLVVGDRTEQARYAFTVSKINWISDKPPSETLQVEVKIRYTAKPVSCTVTPLTRNDVLVRLPDPLYDITPGQAAVFYLGDQCLGGGLIQPEDVKAS